MSLAESTSTSAPAPTSTTLPERVKEEETQGPGDKTSTSTDDVSPSAEEFPQPHLRLHLNDLTDDGTSIFLSSITPINSPPLRRRAGPESPLRAPWWSVPYAQHPERNSYSPAHGRGSLHDGEST
ncbi:hypothetical protein O1611_g7535 [Lasiodiplodia mahajangana]|uniref:Uncharacterized protein n=1 Tax=Lasiodiplodia mahajangana TaxID=1108764 RepID=A0ACC2JFU3_9PEZI|nr:hypothetical protein O1611_g7535 [Lasiodiplodia mahajangana]